MRFHLVAALTLALSAPGCRCGEKLVMVEPARLVATPDALAFPDTWVGATSRVTVELSNQGGEAADAELFIDAPFTPSLARVTLVRGEAQTLELVFSPHAGGHFAAVLHAGPLLIPVQGRGLEVPQCTPSTTCRDARFDTSSAACVEAPSADDTACETSCVRGSCQAGACLGALKDCDDHNACTLDACSETTSCAHSDVTCPVPSNPCEVPTCDPSTGCGSTTARDGTLCGVDDCIATTVGVCIDGRCVPRARPLTGRCANRWVPTVIPARHSPHVAYDGARQRVVLFGGHGTNNHSLGDTWEWDGMRWTQLLPASSPEKREGAAIAYDPGRQRIVLFGGWSSLTQTALGDTWEWDGRTWTLASTDGPTPRASALMAYDAARSRILLVGGMEPFGIGNTETWAWNGQDWTQLSPAHHPPARVGATIAYDSARQLVLLFGGRKAENTGDLNDTWEWNGRDWLERTPAHSPPPRSAATMVYDSDSRRVVLSGGHNLRNSSAYQDTWLWDGRDWSSVPSSALAGVLSAGAAYDSGARKTVTFGGLVRNAYSGSTRLFDGVTWTQATLGASPAWLEGTLVATPQQLLLFGGYASGANNSLWSWDASRTWLQLPSAGTTPRKRAGHAAVWDSTRQRMVVFGGDSRESMPDRITNDTWEWDGMSWVQRMPSRSPSLRAAHAMAFDTARNVTVLFGGVSAADGALLHDTWTWDGTNWTERTTSTTPPCFGPMTYDESRQRVVFLSAYCNGGVFSNETWEWDGTAWSRKQPAVTPPGAVGYGMAYDASRQRVVLTAGQSPGFIALSSTWEWDGTNWLEKQPTVAPSGFGLAAYFAPLQKIVFFDGSTTWIYLP